MYKYKVIWFDDEHYSLNIIREKAFLSNIDLIGFSNAKDGIEELQKNIMHYDAAVIDGIFFQNAGQFGGVFNDKALLDVAIAIERLANLKVLPWFILSGQTSFTKEENRYADGLKSNEVYDKLNDDHLNKLWRNIKAEADKQIETQIRYKYKLVFEVCTKAYVGEEAAGSLLSAIKFSQQATSFDTVDIKDAFTGLRKIAELLFKKLNQIGIIPREIYDTPGWFNPCGYFLCGTHALYKIQEGLIHPSIAFLLKQFVLVTQDSSHSIAEKLKLRVDEFIFSNKTPYLYCSALNQLFDILVWFKKFIDEHPDHNKNKELWSIIENNESLNSREWVAGHIARIATNGWGTFMPKNSTKTLSIKPEVVNKHFLKENMPIEVITEPSPDGTKTYIKEIRKI
jgi:hypothetical protein